MFATAAAIAAGCYVARIYLSVDKTAATSDHPHPHTDEPPAGNMPVTSLCCHERDNPVLIVSISSSYRR